MEQRISDIENINLENSQVEEERIERGKMERTLQKLSASIRKKATQE